mgnify:CR=1 FL=1
MSPNAGQDHAPDDPWRRVLRDLQSGERAVTGPWSTGAMRAFVIAVVALACLAGAWWWTGRPQAQPAMAPSPPVVVASGTALESQGGTLAEVPGARPSSPEPTSSTSMTPSPPAVPVVVVHVAGLVRRPGLVRLPPGSRVADAVEAAGGVTRPRAADSVNLARPVVDGEQILVGVDAPAPVLTGNPLRPSATPTVINLNSATVQQLDALPGIGPVLADRIVAWRSENGPFTSVDELGEVSGIGESVLGSLRDLVRV